MTKITKLMACVLISGCSQSAVLGSAKVFETPAGMVFARPLSAKDTWQAGPDTVGISTHLTPELKSESIKAIEHASGCQVDRDSVTVQSALFVSAAVKCGI